MFMSKTTPDHEKAKKESENEGEDLRHRYRFHGEFCCIVNKVVFL